MAKQPGVEYREEDVTVDGFKIHFLEWGSGGPKIVLLHGSWPWGMAHNLDLLSLPLSRENHLLVPDLPGFGGSDDPQVEMGYKVQIEILHNVVKRRGFNRFTLIGISYGGLLTMVWSALYPEDIRCAVLLDMPPLSYAEPSPPDPRARPQTCPEEFLSREDALEFCAKVYPGFTRDYMVEQLAHGDMDEDGTIVPPSPQYRRQLIRRDRDLWTDLAAISSPILLVYGSESHFFNPGIIESMRKANRGLSVVRVEGATHYLPMTHVKETLGAIKDFMSKTYAIQ